MNTPTSMPPRPGLPLIDREGRLRAFMVSVGRPADATAASRLWAWVQSAWSWPAPALAVSGTDAYQLWFFLEEAVPVTEARLVLKALGEQTPAHAAPMDVTADTVSVDHDFSDEALWPGREVRPGQWSAFVAADLAPLFADTPWLDVAPSSDGQADLLSRIECIPPSDWRAAVARCRAPSVQAEAAVPSASPEASASVAFQDDPKRFLLDVMNDAAAPLALRIEAAKALLPLRDRHP